MPFEIRQGAEVLFDRQWTKRLEACPDYVKVAASVWIMARTNWQYYPEWRRFFNCHREEVQRIWMNAEDFSVLHTFPKPFTLYRGYNKPLGKMGFSWSLDKTVAASIPTHAVHGVGNPWIITAIANPEDVIAYKDSRLEREVIIDPKKILRVLHEEPLKLEERAGKQNRDGKPLKSRGGTKLRTSTLINQLKCKQIVKSPNQRIAVITGVLFKADQRKDVTIEGQKVKIHCLEIREESVLVKIAGVKEPQELLLPPSQKRWKTYCG